ncbi:MAG: hypothetical protein DCC68_13725 [Planctomycetota bacterium]|nr:MAG: hypothetical protein DCC68_13725 [Planctomycetota bacterium]
MRAGHLVVAHAANGPTCYRVLERPAANRFRATYRYGYRSKLRIWNWLDPHRVCPIRSLRNLDAVDSLERRDAAKHFRKPVLAQVLGFGQVAGRVGVAPTDSD